LIARKHRTSPTIAACGFGETGMPLQQTHPLL
jgi:hypothetical protein